MARKKNYVKTLINKIKKEPSRGINYTDFTWLEGLRIVDVKKEDSDEYLLMLDSGDVIRVKANEGCGGCSSGWSEVGDLSVLKSHPDNAIMSVVEEPLDNSEERYRVFVYYSLNDGVSFDYDLCEGNGYYGCGFYLTLVGVTPR